MKLLSTSPAIRLRRVAVAVAITVAVLAVVIAAMGVNPAAAGAAIWQGVVGTPFTIGQTIGIAAVLVLMGLAMLIPFSARLFNVGGEGQLFMGAIGTVSVALGLGDTPVTLPLSILAGVVGGTVWALIPGLLRAFLGASEMIVSLLLNFVAALAAAYVIGTVFPDATGQATQSVARTVRLPVLWAAGGVNAGILIVIVVAVAVWVLITRTRTGFGIRAIGLNPQASILAGFSPRSATITTFALGGACAGLAGALLVLGTSGQLNQGISSGYGFLGVVVALLAGARVAWVPLAAVFIAALTVGSNRLQLAVGLPFSMGIVVVGVLVLTLLATRVITIRRG
ncbi:ABC transporter permease [Herbiconiux sp. VKM Ac-2851]|uniref:ABC transporter permease n=1 Tax=Herbiconiux sp. VKM Ac-2851 TaxID=2739025 RepID=UPI001563CE4D|nr:ABC transporter permease [Herbiconiux sp. VKM Ac-2851]NQX35106.1 ABC transporter permease [Herbiconiux sp. VKM Ac-2851]